MCIRDRLEDIDAEYEKICSQIFEKVADFRLKECQTIMKVGWEIEIKCCEDLLVSAQKLITIYNKIYGEEQDKMKQLELFVASIKKPIEEALEKKVDLDYTKIYN
eukprot:TRINITY_DN5558_c0_g1_i1.p1 TRINITY_DN5558_c0_g1~~TRINITY_DN5558_c0_g1_i1.p1  ORF type:complete len:105 (+),score=28.35 TRINITY_DN5558_c0_g1_i1:64-378(+)